MHRDLKPENFLYANKKETAALKAIDFGLSVFFKPGTNFHLIYKTFDLPLFFYLFSLYEGYFNFEQVKDLMKLLGVRITWLLKF